MKILKEKYPKGTFAYQKTDGRYIEGYLYENLKLLATRIVDDMTFLGVGFSSTLEVGTGKSVLFTQIGETWTHLVNKIHGLDLTFTQKNIVFRPKDLTERAFQLPKYSCILIDEWDDAHYWSELGMSLRKFFRKCRQLNLFILLIIPNFFQLPINYAVSRSIFAIDVKFAEDFQRGFFDFYNFQAKRTLYLKGKKEHNYHVVHRNFNGRFLDGYGVPEKEYREAKLKDMLLMEAEEKKKPTETQMKVELFEKLDGKLNLNRKGWAECFGVTTKTISNWRNNDYDWRDEEEREVGNTYTIINKKKIDYSEEEQLEQEEKKDEPY